mmetsp:Transcript_314/g.667  ORF Transcript_314/g.667 Transcript_314/m.667 type:complete len:1701 (-) Transcript_314:40-5142(-)
MPREKKSKSPNRKFWAHPSAQDRNSSFDHDSGHVRNTGEIIDRRKKKGKCPKCGLVKTHKKGVFGLLLTKDTRVGQVYKGICLRCNTLYQAKLMLGEPVDADLDRGTIMETQQIRSNSNNTPVAAVTAVAADRNAQHHTSDRRLSSSSIRAMDETGSMDQTGVSQSRHGSRNQGGISNQSSSNSGSTNPPLPPPPLYRQQANNETTVPSEINQRETMTRHISEISIPPEFQDLSNERSSISSEYYLMGILEDDQYGNNMQQMELPMGSSSTSIGQQSRDCRGSGGNVTSYTSTANRSTPGVEHFDGSSGGRHNEFYQRLLDKASGKPAAAASSSSSSSSSVRSANSSQATSTRALTSSYKRSHIENDTITSPSSPSPTPISSLQRSITNTDSPGASAGASAVSLDDQDEAQKKINEADTLQRKRSSSSQDEFDMRSIGEEGVSSPGAKRAIGKGRIYHRKCTEGSQEESKRNADDEIVTPGAKHATGRDRIYDRKGSQEESKRDACGEASRPGAKHATGRDRIYHRKSIEGGQDESKPGATHATGKRGSLYDRKMVDEGINRPTNNAVDEEVVNDTKRMDDIYAQELIDNSTNCNELFDFLKKNSPLSAPSMIRILIRIRDLLPVSSESSSSRLSWTSEGSANTNKSLPNDWPTLAFNAISDHPSDEMVQAEGFRTMWTITSTNIHFASDLTSYAAKKDIMHAMDTHRRSSLLQGYGAGLIACVVSIEKYALQFLNVNDGKVIKRLMNALKYHYNDGNDHYLNGSVQENVLKALYHLSSASLASSRPMVFFGKKMGHFAGIASAERNPSLHAVEAVLHAMEPLYLKNLSLQIFGNRLLYNIFSFDLIDDEERCNKWISKYLIYAMAAKTCHLKSRAFSESLICFLSKISDRGVASLNRHLFLTIIADVISSSDSPIVAHHGCRCFHNVCALDPEPVSSSQAEVAAVDGITNIISLMEAFKEHQSVQSEACLALVALCAKSSTNKAMVLEEGGIEGIFSAYLSFGSSKPYEGVGLMTKVRACSALISLALDPACKIEMKSSGIIEKFNSILQEDEKIPHELRSLIERLLILTSDEEGDDWLLEFKDGASEDETVVCILAHLRMITNNDDDHHVDTSSLMQNSLRAISKFSSSRAVQESACKVLACLYSSNQRQTGAEQSYIDVLEAVEVSLREHQNCHTVVAAASSVISNMCTTCMTPADEETSQILSDTFYTIILEVVNAMELCIDDITAAEQSSGALWALCNAKPSLVVSLGTINPGKSNTINVLIDAMKKFPSSIELHTNAISVMHSFFIQSENIIKDERSIACVVNVSSVLSKFMKESEGEVATIGTALKILNILADERGYDAKIALSENDEIIAAIVSCMFSYPDSFVIQGTACDIIRTLAVNNLKRSQICHQGGTTRIIDSLKRMKKDSYFVYKGFMALENLVSGADVDVLTANDTPKVVLNAIESLHQSINVQIHGAEAIFHLSSRHDSFKEALVRLGAARLISEAMTRFLPSWEMQQKGCIAIWSISTPKALRSEVGHYAITPIIDGVSAHCSPDDLPSSPQGDKQKFCEDALGAVKCLSTTTTNKRSLEESGAIDLICSIIWLHGDNADLCKAALSALSNICADRDTNQILRISADVLDALVQTMRTHQNKKEVQSLAIVLLRNLTFSPTNCLILQQNKYVSTLVHNAMVNFNTSFEGRAEDVLRVMPSLNQ